MKTLLVILSLIGFISLNSCIQETNPQALMETHKSRTVVYNAIAQNDDYMMEFMANLQNNENAMEMTQGNNKMMGSMIKGENMQMMMKDSSMMHSMMNGIMNDGKMMGTMMKMMHEKGMVSEDCMESCSKMMGEKGMDIQGMNKMGNMDTPTKDDHKVHH